jgi:hypothetical protein
MKMSDFYNVMFVTGLKFVSLNFLKNETNTDNPYSSLPISKCIFTNNFNN